MLVKFDCGCMPSIAVLTRRSRLDLKATCSGELVLQGSTKGKTSREDTGQSYQFIVVSIQRETARVP